jgi:glycyl-tRNA synthetase|eukprot:TRINITY_DN51012_c0_g1_i1.p1 TRINITY_DN51012_c0_g1~~TRINITY_DN51012_c0_g1_i1.p1  ORF type:complete len:673 (-),score=130.37 TRINITY_DN51012_c0_g1_i1:108-2126(-)
MTGAVGDFLETSIKYRILRANGGYTATSPKARQISAAVSAGPAVPPAESAKLFQNNQKDLSELCKRRFFFRPAFDIYGGVAGFFTYGPPGCAMKNNLIKLWRQHFVIEDNLLEVEDTAIMPHNVLKASGHVDKFNDFMVKDVDDTAKFYRADKLLEEVMDQKLAEPNVTEAQRQEYTSVRNQADAYSKEELTAVFKKYEIKAPDSGNDLSDPYEFNLMFPTPIGPGGYLQGYLRPETAQGIFLNYKFCIEQNANRLPFGVAQVGKSFRNEIAPRAGLTRQREFTQAEIEYFVNPANRAHVKFSRIADVALNLFHSNEQLAAKEPLRMTIRDAIQNGVLSNETLAYFMVRTQLFLISAGVRADCLRFRQHLPTEMAHYACDCWDAEILTSYGWLECVGIADRACFDLNAHGKAAKVDLTYKETLDKPIEREVLAITKQSGILVMKAFGKDGRMVKDWIEALPQEEKAELKRVVEADGKKEVEIEGKTFVLQQSQLIFEIKKEKQTVNSFFPGVVEPSFGIDRIFTSILEHVYYSRPKEDTSEDKNTRGVLSLPSNIAPYKCAILPLDQRISKSEKYSSMMETFRRQLSTMGLSYTIDDSGATIGRRYARNDELGIPFAVTIDFDSIEDGTVTLRERDAMQQIRLPLTEVADKVRLLCNGELVWTDVYAKLGSK